MQHSEMVQMTPLKRVRLSDPRQPSQEDVASAVGITQSFYLRLEHCERGASVELAGSIAEFFGVEVSAIFTPSRFSSELETAPVEA